MHAAVANRLERAAQFEGPARFLLRMAAIGIDDRRTGIQDEAGDPRATGGLGDLPHRLRHVDAVRREAAASGDRVVRHHRRRVEPHAVPVDVFGDPVRFQGVKFPIAAREEDQDARHVGQDLILALQRASHPQIVEMADRVEHLAGFRAGQFPDPVHAECPRSPAFVAKARDMRRPLETRDGAAGEAAFAGLTVGVDVGKIRRPG